MSSIQANPSPHARHWDLDPSITFLNHGSFGACPLDVLAYQSELRARLEREPVAFFIRELEPLADAARASLAEFVDCDAEDLAFVPNATSGVNTVLSSLDFEPGDELLVTDHAYNACHNAFDRKAERTGARVVVAPLPFPVKSADEVVQSILAAAGPRTKLALIDHVTSKTALVLPIDTIVRALDERGIDTVVDGAHAPGMVDLSLDSIGAAYYTGNAHKWPCAPKGAAFLHVRRDRQARIDPLVISHGLNSTRTDRSRFRRLFDWTGTGDPTPFLCVPEALRTIGSLVPGGWAEVRATNRELVLEGRSILLDALGQDEPAPVGMIGSIASIPLPAASSPVLDVLPFTDPLQEALFHEERIEVPIIGGPGDLRIVRISAQLYNDRTQYERLAEALTRQLRST